MDEKPENKATAAAGNVEPLPAMTPEDAFVRQMFGQYYSQRASQIVFPPAVESREFGAGWRNKIDFRHKSFGGERDLTEFLVRAAPFYISYSTARYSLPAARPMEKKMFLGADIAFDLDKPREVPEHEHNSVFCSICFGCTRADAVLFVEEFLFGDFGFSEKDVLLNFSGSKGFHFHIRSPAVEQLSSNGRKQLCDYAAALNVSTDFLFEKKKFGTRKNDYALAGPSLQDGGWKSRAYQEISTLLQSADEEALKAEGLSSKKAKLLLEKKEVILQKIAVGDYGAPEGFEEFWRGVAQKAVANSRVELDTPVTFDLARLIRLPQTLHGDSGLVAKIVSRKELESFDPLRDAVAFPKGAVGVTPLQDVELEYFGKQVLLKAGERQPCPLGLAIMLLRKGKAKLG